MRECPGHCRATANSGTAECETTEETSRHNPVMPAGQSHHPPDQLPGQEQPCQVWGKLPGKPLVPQLSPTAQLTLDGSLSNPACRCSINREGSSGLKDPMVHGQIRAQLGSPGWQHPLGWQHPCSQQQGCTSTCRATAGAHTEDKAPSQGWDPLPGAGFSTLTDTNPYNSWRDG